MNIGMEKMNVGNKPMNSIITTRSSQYMVRTPTMRALVTRALMKRTLMLRALVTRALMKRTLMLRALMTKTVMVRTLIVRSKSKK